MALVGESSDERLLEKAVINERKFVVGCTIRSWKSDEPIEYYFVAYIRESSVGKVVCEECKRWRRLGKAAMPTRYLKVRTDRRRENVRLIKECL